MIIYADILLAVNWWVDFLLLSGVARACGIETRGWRLALGALAGAAFSLTILLPPLPVWASLPLKLAAAAGMVAAAFPWRGWRAALRPLLWLFALSAGLAGLCAALYFYLAPPGIYVYNGVVYYDAPTLLLVILTVLCYGILRLFERVLRRRAPAALRYTLEVTQEGRSIRVPCLYDSGNHLTEPFSGRPVVVMERSTVEALLPVPADVTALPPDGSWRVIPYTALGGSGLLPAFVPRRLTVHTPGGERELHDCYIAVCDRLGRGEYRGLLGSAVGEQLADSTALPG